jgi:hypothetical protein
MPLSDALFEDRVMKMSDIASATAVPSAHRSSSTYDNARCVPGDCRCDENELFPIARKGPRVWTPGWSIRRTVSAGRGRSGISRAAGILNWPLEYRSRNADRQNRRVSGPGSI